MPLIKWIKLKASKARKDWENYCDMNNPYKGRYYEEMMRAASVYQQMVGYVTWP